jgi:hypothetical protein
MARATTLSEVTSSNVALPESTTKAKSEYRNKAHRPHSMIAIRRRDDGAGVEAAASIFLIMMSGLIAFRKLAGEYQRRGSFSFIIMPTYAEL